ncbi:MAG: GNAT family N-acetyltransferase [Methanomicrobiales archaeon]
MDYTIRYAKENDFIEIAKLAEQCKPMSTERNSIYHIFTKFFSNTSLVFESNKNNEIYGFLLGFISQKNLEEAYIHLLCLRTEIRGKGFAKKIIEKFSHEIKSKGCKKITLITKPINKDAIKFYTKLGFKHIIPPDDKSLEVNGVITCKDYNGKGEHMVIFQKPLDNELHIYNKV